MTKKTIVIIFSYHDGFEGWEDYEEAFSESDAIETIRDKLKYEDKHGYNVLKHWDVYYLAEDLEKRIKIALKE